MCLGLLSVCFQISPSIQRAFVLVASTGTLTAASGISLEEAIPVLTGTVVAKADDSIAVWPKYTGAQYLYSSEKQNTFLRVFKDDPSESARDIVLSETAIPKIAVFSGANTTPENELKDNAGPVTFPETRQGTVSAVQTFTIWNIGGDDLTGISISMLGINAADYQVVPSATSTLAAGATVSFSATFSPTGPFARNAVVSITCNELHETPFEIPVTGKAIAPDISVEDSQGSLIETGHLFAWGRDEHHQTTIPDTAKYGVRQIALGNWHSMALKNDGTLIPWGEGYNNEPTVPTGLGVVKAIAAGLSYNVAIKQNGSLSAWGSNFQRQTVVPTVTDAKAISTGVNHGVVLGSGGALMPWGSGIASLQPSSFAATGVKAIAAGYYHNLSLKNDGTVVSWGNSTYPNEYWVPMLTNIVAVSAGNGYSLALKADGTVWRWVGAASPVKLDITGAVAISAGGSHYVVLKDDGTVVAFGSNTYGQTDVPAGLPRISYIKAGDVNTMAIANTRVDFGNLAIGSTSPPKTYTIKNSGSDPLHITGVIMTSGNTADFSPDTDDMLTTVPVGGQTTFSISYTPSAGGIRSSILRITSDDPDEGFYEMELQGTNYTALEAWRQKFFGTTTVDANTTLLGDFDKDGLSNLVEYAFGTDPSQNTPADGRVEVKRTGDLLTVSYRRPEGGAPGVSYDVELSDSDISAWIKGVFGSDYSQSVLPNDDGTETVTITLIGDMADCRFARLRISK
jgi:hypothetical protein